jgi:hypothetical protein
MHVRAAGSPLISIASIKLPGEADMNACVCVLQEFCIFIENIII